MSHDILRFNTRAEPTAVRVVVILYPAGGARAGKDQVGRASTSGEGPGGGSSTGALCTGFTLVMMIFNMSTSYFHINLIPYFEDYLMMKLTSS